jgi:hypothetical protein
VWKDLTIRLERVLGKQLATFLKQKHIKEQEAGRRTEELTLKQTNKEEHPTHFAWE